jgi:hypothetical protein
MAIARVLPLRPSRLGIVPERLESCVRRLDPADRALLDLSLNRGIPDATMASILRTDPLRLAWRRARAIERVASRLGMSDPADLPAVRTALADLPSRAWLPLELQPAKPPPLPLHPPERTPPRDPPEAPPAVRAPEPPPPLHPPEPPDEEPRVIRPSWTRVAKPPRPEAAPARPEARPLAAPANPLAAPVGRAAASPLGGRDVRAKRAYPRGTRRTHVRRAAGALAVGAAALLALKLR